GAPSRRRGAENGVGPDGQPLGPDGGNGSGAKRSKKGLLIGGVVVLVLAGAAAGTYVYSQGQYYVKPSSDGKQVQLYQGTTQLSFLASQVNLPDGALYLNSVPAEKRGDLTKTVTFSSKEGALKYLEPYRKAAKSCWDVRHGVAPQTQAQAQTQAKGAPQHLDPSSPSTQEPKGGSLIGGDPSTSPTTGGASNQPTDGASTQLPGDTATTNPSPQPSSSVPPPGEGESQMQAYCAGTTDGP
ncbi:MAG: hypothetical protein HOW97_01345, partial [Catenulispora sp.]|nr:hypothetical protein [Catenulispora sp.]